MTIFMLIRTIFECLLFAGIAWGIFHEDLLVAMERQLFAAIRRRRLHVVKARYPKKKYLRN